MKKRTRKINNNPSRLRPIKQRLNDHQKLMRIMRAAYRGVRRLSAKNELNLDHMKDEQIYEPLS
mgnify:CR=1 FL=1